MTAEAGVIAIIGALRNGQVVAVGTMPTDVAGVNAITMTNEAGAAAIATTNAPAGAVAITVTTTEIGAMVASPM